MGYRVYLLDGINHTELDCENVDLITTFSVADLKDLAKRSDNITKQVFFKDTKKNNYAFGSLFHLNRTTSSSISNKLFSNYNPIREVDCLIYEDGALIFKGSMRVTDVIVGSGYETIITGKFTEFRTKIQDKTLSDLNLSDLQHPYTWTTIQNTWTAPKGDKFVYPHIDYGYVFNNLGATADKTRFNCVNYRPALYVKEYFKRIHAEAGFTYEIKGDTDFKQKFDSLIIPDNQAKVSYPLSGFNTKFAKNPGTVVTSSSPGIKYNNDWKGRLVPMPIFTPPAGMSSNYLYYYGAAPKYDNVFFIYRTITTDAHINMVFGNVENTHTSRVGEMWVEFVERSEINNDSPHMNWNVIYQVKFDVPPATNWINKIINMPVGEREYKEGTQLGIRILTIPMQGDKHVHYTLNHSELSMPKDANTQVKIDLVIDSTDTITPKAPAGIKQADFIKSIINLFNLYVYTDKHRPKHIIYERYDDYYALCSPSALKSTALDWTRKVDRSGKLKLAPNLQIPKSYQFTFKEDSDYLNNDHKKKYGKIYGSFQFADSFGVTPEKKMELIFSPTPCLQESGKIKLYPALYEVDGGNKKPKGTNIRILYYNGVQPCEEWLSTKEYFNAGQWLVSTVATLTHYPQASNYYLVNGKPVDDLHFGRPIEFYFTANNDHINANTSYTNYYINQVSELTNINLLTIELDMVLNELDISNLDLKTPVFLDFGANGHGYFKVLSVEYISNKLKTEVRLQKIVVGTNR